jgi:hypothetical protein
MSMKPDQSAPNRALKGANIAVQFFRDLADFYVAKFGMRARQAVTTFHFTYSGSATARILSPDTASQPYVGSACDRY